MRLTKLPYCCVLGILVAFVGGCPGADTLPRPNFLPKSTMTLATSPRCSGKTCQCRPPGAEVEANIPAGKKRFELRLPRSTSEIWIEVAGEGVYYKPAEKVDPQCVYLDLKPGQHQITLFAKGGDAEVGLQSGLTIHEYAQPKGQAPNWYRSFHFACGKGASPCTDLEVQNWTRYQRGLLRGVLDPCGSVRALATRTAGTRTRKNDEVYHDLTLVFSLKVYRFAPYRPSGSPKCKGPSKNRP
ncbi:MAG: hypothetical protein JRH20_16660 [Deltaproteobacteria bacterium]|nr:hypothetical protein [Deltaproteobacteria bacterium]